jgi:hypothetical protein
MSTRQTSTDDAAPEGKRKQDWVKPQVVVITIKEAMSGTNLMHNTDLAAGYT